MWWFCRFRTALVFLTAVIVCEVILTDAANETASVTDTSSSVLGLQPSHVMPTSTPAMEMESDMMSTPTTESHVMSTPPMETGPPSHTPLILSSSTQTMAVPSESIFSSHTVIMPSSEMPESSLGDTNSVSPTSPMMETTQGLPTATPVMPQATEVQPSPASSDMVSSTLLSGVEVTSVAPGCSAKPCKNGATCNESGSEFNCTCAAGWTGNTCETDIDECKADHNCSENADCENVDASYNCTCKPGYEGDGWQCKDIDECSDTELNDCLSDARADCQNTNGSFECTCELGFTGDGKTQCQDVDECSNATLNDCLKNEWALCDNTDGSYNCSCKPGFRGDGKTLCKDIDECVIEASNDCLDDVATCANTNGSYECSCKLGFSGDGTTECIDIDDCVDKPCQNGGVCYNTEAGHFDCICPPGWTNHTCNTDIDECSLENSACHENAECENKPPGSFTCTCMAGYRGNGAHCTEIMLFEDKADAMVKQGLGSMETSYGPFSLDGGQPDVYVHMNGYISVGDRLTSPYPPGLDERDNFPAQVFAPFWTSIDSREGPGKLVISVLRDSEDAAMLNTIKEVLDGGDKIDKLRSGVIATWHMVSPPPASSYKDKEMATFQAVVVSDWTSSWVVLNYDLGTLSWDADSDKRTILVGHAEKNKTFIVLAAEPMGDGNETSAYKIDTRKGNKEKVGRWQFDVSGSQPEVGQCLIWFSDIDHSLVKAKLDSLTACPCTRDQAQVDLNYIYDETENLATHVFDQRVQCVYDSEFAFLVRGSPSGGYPILPETDDFNQTKGRELCCKDGVNLCSLFYELYPSDDCSSYHLPAQAFSWGDPHIITTRGVEYTFNGLGEFLLWKAGNFEIQSRTTLDTDSGNTTQFTAFVMKNADSDHIGLRYNAGEIDVAVNGENLDPTPATSVLNGVVLRSQSDAVIVSFPNAVNFKISVGVGGLQLSSMLPEDLVSGENSGLMAMTDNGMFQFENKTKIPADASEAELFLYGMSWQVSNTSSLFSYTLDGGQDYEDFNPAGGFTPVFYSDMTVEEMFPDNATRDRATELCHSYKACLGDLAATSNEDLANQTYQHMKHLKDIADKLANMPPVWDRMPSELNLTVGKTLEIWHHAYDNNTGDNVTIIYPDELWSSDTFTVETDNKTYLKLTPLKGAQDAPMSLKLVASDGKGGASEYWPAIFLCACQDPSECQDVSPDDMRSKDRFYVRPCDCLPGYEGDYCETEYDVCQRDQPCYPGVNCTVVSAGNFSCSPCPSGLNGDGASCYDVNECLEANDCEHPETCNNLPGNYTCGCRWGFTQDDNGKNCTDIDECQEVMGRCGNGAYCTNTEGGFACDCIPGYFNQSGICVKDLSLRQYSIELRITATKSGGPVTFNEDYNDKSSAMFQELKDTVVNSLTPALEKVKGFTSVDIVAFRNGSVMADTVVTFDEPVDPNDINKVWGSCVKSCELGDLLVAEAPTVAVRDFCKDDSQNDCDKMSTMCKNNNGTFRCDCNPGFRPSPYYSSRCDDIDECKSSPSPCGDATCENTAGSFSCVCQDGLLFLSGEKKCVDKCHSNSCKNSGVCVIIGEATACKCGEDWTGPTCEEEAQPWKQSLIIVAAVLGSVCLIAFIIIIVLCCRRKQKKSSTPDFSNVLDSGSLKNVESFAMHSMPSRRSKSKAFGELSDSSGEVEAKAYQGWSGKIPRPKRNTADNLEMVENGNRGMVSDYYDPRADDPSKPLTGFGGKGLEGHDNPTYTEGGDQNGQQARGGKASNEYF